MVRVKVSIQPSASNLCTDDFALAHLRCNQFERSCLLHKHVHHQFKGWKYVPMLLLLLLFKSLYTADRY